jgi:flagellar hook-length control protein FliK
MPADPKKSETQISGSQKEEKGDAEKNDNGMPDDPSAKAAIYGIVGILEGFEPPSYQSDNTACIGIENVTPLSPQPAVQNSSAVQAPQNQTAANGEGSNELPEQIARMLQNNQAGAKPVQTQDDILKIVGEYLDSLENTNSQTAGKAPAAAVVKNGTENIQNGILPTDTTVTGKPEGSTLKGVIPEGGARPGNASVAEGESVPKVLPEQAAMQAGPAAAETQKGEARPKAAEVKIADAKPADIKPADVKPDVKPAETGKPEDAADAAGRGAVNSAQAADYTAETEQAAAVKLEAKPETVRESVLKIVDKVKTEASEGKYDFDIDLKPEFMGKVSIKLTMSEGSVKVQIKAEDVAVKGMLYDQMTNLHMMLKEKGIPVSTIDIASGGNMTSGREESQGQYDRRNPQSNHTYEPAAEGTYESAKEKYDFYLGGSYVEYLA